MASAADTSTARVGITAAFFQGKVKHEVLPLSLGRVYMHLPDSKTEISFLLPDQQVSGFPQPLPFKVQKKGQFEQDRAGLSLTVEKVRTFTMSVLVFEPGPKVGPKVMQPDGSVWQQETLKSSTREVPVERPAEIQPGEYYQLKISSEDGASATAKLVKVDGPTKAAKITAESPLVKAALTLLEGPLKAAIASTKAWIATPLSQRQYPFCKNVKAGDFSREAALASLVKVFKSLHIETRARLQRMPEADQNAELRKVLSGEDGVQVLTDQLRVVIGEKTAAGHPNWSLMGATDTIAVAARSEVVTPFILAVRGS